MHVVAYFVNKCVVQDLHLRSWWYGGDIHKLRCDAKNKYQNLDENFIQQKVVQVC